MKNVLVLFILVFVISVLVGCAPVRDVRDTAGNISGEIGEVSDELGKAHTIGRGEDAIVVEPAADKKIRMKF